MFPAITMILPFFKEWLSNPFSDKNIKRTLIIAIIIMALFMLRSCQGSAELKAELKKQKLVAENNYDALNGQVKTLKTKNGELEYTKTILYTDAEQLKKLNGKLAGELEKEKGKVKVIVDVQTKVELVPVSVPNTLIKYGAGLYGLKFNSTYRDSGLVSEVEGISKFKIDSLTNKLFADSTKILKNNFTVDIVYGMRERDDKIEIFARSKSPLVSFNEINGAYIQTKGNSILPDDKPQPKIYNWGFGPQLGYSYLWPANAHNITLVANLQYRLKDFVFCVNTGAFYMAGQNIPNLSIGARVQYNIFKW
jgi:hypothetical protein